MTMPSLFTNDWQNRCVHELFERQVACTPDALALWTQEDGELTYQQLNMRANQIAHWLKGQGIENEDIVGLSMRRTADFFACLWGVLKAGAAWLYLPPEYPQERRISMIQDAKARLILSDHQEIHEGIPTFFLPQYRQEIEQESRENPFFYLSAQSLAYIIFTSGTQQRKGVLIEHKGLTRLARAQIEGFDIEPSDRLSQFLLPAFDAFLSELLTAHLSGASLIVVPDTLRRLPLKVAGFLRDHQITVATFTPTILRSLPPDDLPLLRLIISGGEVCTHDIIERWSTAQRCLINAYGPTETTVCVSFSECRPDTWQPSLGYPLPETTISIRDVTTHLPVPEGTSGEICISGPGVARGYVDAEQTIRRFIEDPLNSSEKMYLTGDLGVMDSNGELFFQGRVDDEMKLIGGYRVSPGEIEAALHLHTVDGTVLLIDGVLVACVVVPEEKQTTEALLRMKLSQRLPAYMLPRVFFFFDSLPRNESDKIDKNRLAQVVREHWEKTSLARYAMTPLEQQVADLVAEIHRRTTGLLLQAETLDLNISFARLGASSLATASLLVSIERRYGIELEPEYVASQPLLEVIQFIAQHQEVA